MFDKAFAGLSQGREAFTPQLTPREIGTITSIATGIAKVSGLPNAGFDELVTFPGDVLGIAFNVDETEIGAVLLGDYWHLQAGDEVDAHWPRVHGRHRGRRAAGSRHRPAWPATRWQRARGVTVAASRSNARRPALWIEHLLPCLSRLGSKSSTPLFPLGVASANLILGDRTDRQNGHCRSTTILNQRDHNVLCVYCAIGQRASAVAKAVAALREKGAMDYTVVVVTEGDDPPGLAFIAPYAATSTSRSISWKQAETF